MPGELAVASLEDSTVQLFNLFPQVLCASGACVLRTHCMSGPEPGFGMNLNSMQKGPVLRVDYLVVKTGTKELTITQSSMLVRRSKETKNPSPAEYRTPEPLSQGRRG